MIPNNNLSVLPWYTSIEQQNARKWWIYGKVYPLFTPAGFMLPFQLLRAHRTGTTISYFKVYTKGGVLVGDFTTAIKQMGLTIVPFAALGYDVIVFAGQLPVFTAMDNGQYYAVLNDGTDTWYSEVFTVVNDITGYLKLEWWDDENFVMDAGTIVYTNPNFKNVLYLCSDIAKPEYDFDDQVIERGGYTFPVQQISKKRYRFSFLASEYLLDVMRFVRMADYAQVTKHGQTYTLDTFLITPDWEDNGDVAAVDAEFTTATVAKKIGVGYIKAQRGDFNDDFNNDFDISSGPTPPPPPPPPVETYIELQETQLYVAPTGGQVTARIKTNTGKTWAVVSQDSNILSVTPSTAVGTDGFTDVVIEVAATSTTRTLNIVFGVVGESEKTATLNISQSTASESIHIYNHNGFDDTETISGSASYAYPDMIASGAWVAETNASWLWFDSQHTEKQTSGSASSRYALFVYPEINNTGETRSAVITAHLVENPSIQATYTLVQLSL